MLIWNTFPSTNFQPADAVLGQSDFVHNAYNDDNQDGSPDGGVNSIPSARTLYYPEGIILVRDRLIVSDRENHRVLEYLAN